MLKANLLKKELDGSTELDTVKYSEILSLIGR